MQLQQIILSFFFKRKYKEVRFIYKNNTAWPKFLNDSVYNARVFKMIETTRETRNLLARCCVNDETVNSVQPVSQLYSPLVSRDFSFVEEESKRERSGRASIRPTPISRRFSAFSLLLSVVAAAPSHDTETTVTKRIFACK